MSLTNKVTGLTAAEERRLASESAELEQALKSETENAELLMLRAMNKQLMLKLSDYEAVTDKLYSRAENTEQILRELKSSVTADLNTATAEHYAQLITSCRTLDGTVQSMAEGESRLADLMNRQTAAIITALNGAHDELKRRIRTATALILGTVVAATVLIVLT